jgi:hypothetical protein
MINYELIKTEINNVRTAFKNIDDILHKDAGCGNELDYVEQSSWISGLCFLSRLFISPEGAKYDSEAARSLANA